MCVPANTSVVIIKILVRKFMLKDKTNIFTIHIKQHPELIGNSVYIILHAWGTPGRSTGSQGDAKMKNCETQGFLRRLIDATLLPSNGHENATSASQFALRQ